MKKCGIIGAIAFALVIVGGLNWGLVGALDFNLVTFLVGKWPAVEKAVYILVGASAIFSSIKCATSCKR